MKMTPCPACWEMGINEVKKFAGGKRNFYWAKQPRQDKNTCAAKEGPPSYVLYEYSFASVSTVSRGYPSLVSLSLLHHGFFLQFLGRGRGGDTGSCKNLREKFSWYCPFKNNGSPWQVTDLSGSFFTVATFWL
jgi:hypothetical protein